MLVAALLLAVGVTACSRDESSSLPRPSKPFCEAAHRYDVRVEKLAPIGEQINIVQEMADHAPKDIAKDTETFLDALQRRARRRQVGRRQCEDQGRGRQREPARRDGLQSRSSKNPEAGSDGAGRSRRGTLALVVHVPALRGRRGSGIGRRDHRRVHRHRQRQRRRAAHERRPARRAAKANRSRSPATSLRQFAAQNPTSNTTVKVSVIDGVIDVTSDEQESTGPTYSADDVNVDDYFDAGVGLYRVDVDEQRRSGGTASTRRTFSSRATRCRGPQA